MRRISAICCSCIMPALASGCASSYNGHGKLYGCDGSGAGVVLRWGPTAQQGAREGGFKGIMEPYRWQTGLGVAADHLSSVSYKRRAAAGLASKVIDHRSDHPNDPVYLAGLSAGCAVVIYALEALPESASVDQVFLLSSSVSAGLDLTRALGRVRGKVYVSTSPRDKVLRQLVSTVGTADRSGAGSQISGLRGFQPPAGISSEARELYRSKVVNIAWKPEFARYGHRGGHTDVMAKPFVARYIAPLMVPAPAILSESQ